MRRLRPGVWFALLLSIALVATACGTKKATTGSGTTTTAKEAAGKKGGKATFLAEQWPECLNVITSCGSSSWLHWTTSQHVLPKLVEVNEKGDFAASPLITELPSLANGGLKEDPFVVTFKLNPKAVWDDGTPITSADVDFTWQAIMKTTGSQGTLGYDKIKSIDTTDPQKAIITFTEVFADWQDLFGGASTNGYVLKKAAFKAVDTKDDMKDGYTFSGGPWKLQSWSPEQAVLVRNDKYWEASRVPLLDQVTFVPRQDAETEIQGILTGEGLAAYPQPSPQITKKLAAPGVKFTRGQGSTYEVLSLNQSKGRIFETAAVREAFAYSVDRQAVVDNLIVPDFPGYKPLNCAGWVPTVGKWCDDTDFAKFKYDPAKAKDILTKDGWVLGSDGIFAKGGTKLTIKWSVTKGNTGRETFQQLQIEKSKAAGIELVPDNIPGGELFQNRLPSLQYDLTEFANSASPDPSVTALFACDQIPTATNKAGQNWSAWCDTAATQLMKDADKTLDPAKRLTITQQVGNAQVVGLPWLPLYQKPLLVTWRDDKLAGPVDKFVNSSYSAFWNMYAWSLK